MPLSAMPPGSGPSCGEPIDISSGLDLMATTDARIDGNLLNVVFTRIMRANSVGGQIATDLGPFGFRGNHNYNLSLNVGTRATASASASSCQTGDTSLCPSTGRGFGGSNNMLINTSDPEMQGAVFTPANDASATLRFKNGTAYKFVRLVGPDPSFRCSIRLPIPMAIP